MRPDADVLIVGGGPSGLAAAIAATRAGRSALVIEKRPGIIDKACGEGLMPGALGSLAALGVEGVAGRPFRGIRYRDARDPARFADGDFPGASGRGVRRTTLHDALLQAAIRAGVRRVEARVEQVEQHADGVRAAGLTGRHLIAADGLHSPIRRQLGLDRPPTRGRPRYGVRRHYRLAPWIDRVEVHWAADAEAYVTPVAPDAVGVAFLFHKPARFAGLMDRFPLLAEQLAGAESIGSTRGAGPFHQRARRVTAGRVLLVGDAAGYLDPLTGEGIAIGLASARAAIAAIAADDVPGYRRRWRRVTRRYLALTGGLLAISRVAPLRRLIIPVVQRAPFVFDLALRLLGGQDEAVGLEGPPPAVGYSRLG